MAMPSCGGMRSVHGLEQPMSIWIRTLTNKCHYRTPYYVQLTCHFMLLKFWMRSNLDTASQCVAEVVIVYSWDAV